MRKISNSNRSKTLPVDFKKHSDREVMVEPVRPAGPQAKRQRTPLPTPASSSAAIETQILAELHDQRVIQLGSVAILQIQQAETKLSEAFGIARENMRFVGASTDLALDSLANVAKVVVDFADTIKSMGTSPAAVKMIASAGLQCLFKRAESCKATVEEIRFALWQKGQNDRRQICGRFRSSRCRAGYGCNRKHVKQDLTHVPTRGYPA